MSEANKQNEASGGATGGSSTCPKCGGPKCGGLKGELDKAYGFAGKWCYCGEVTYESVPCFLPNRAQEFRAIAKKVLDYQLGEGGEPHITVPVINAPTAAPLKAPSFRLTVASNGWIVRTSTGQLLVCVDWHEFAKWCKEYLETASVTEVRL